MSHTARLISSLTLLISVFFITGCSLFDVQPAAKEQLNQKLNYQRVFYANYDAVWRAAHAALKYTIAAENQDTGMIETEYIRGIDGWIPPEGEKPSSGLRYKLVMSFAKGQTNGRESVRVTIEKKIEVLRDFFSDPERLMSDGMEEKLLFYRIERELIISDALKKVN